MMSDIAVKDAWVTTLFRRWAFGLLDCSLDKAKKSTSHALISGMKGGYLHKGLLLFNKLVVE